MATNLQSPGVYVFERPSADKPIAGVGTSTAVFLGVCKKDVAIPYPNDHYHAESWEKDEADIEDLKAKSDALKVQIDAAAPGPEKANLEAGKKEIDKRRTTLNTALTEKKNKAGKPYILKAAPTDLKETGKFEIQVEELGVRLYTNFSQFTRDFGGFSIDDDQHAYFVHGVYGFFQNGGTRCWVVRMKGENQVADALAKIESIDEIAIVVAPGLTSEETHNQIKTHCERTEDRFGILDCSLEISMPGKTSEDIKKELRGKDRNCAWYYPWLKVIDQKKMLLDIEQNTGGELRAGRRYIPPSGHVAGIYAAVDNTRGVHKAPANVKVQGVSRLSRYVTRREQAGLNPDGINCIRDINGTITVYGARTCGGDQNFEWKYVSARRLFLFIRESIDQGTQWAVFEPNDRALWGKIRRNVGAFLTRVWRDGGLFGATPQEAFYVKCDEETNPPEVREAGQVVAEIGIAITKPAEFVIFNIQQTLDPSKQ